MIRKKGARDVATPSHYFVKLLQEKMILHKYFTQNADTLETKTGMDCSDVVWAHGSTTKAHCSVCDIDDCPIATHDAMCEGVVRYCQSCAAKGQKSPVKPRVVFFGEKMPLEFKEESSEEALANVDLLLIIGTTLKVKPFGYIPMHVPKDVP